jgi:hypothetical protein
LSNKSIKHLLKQTDNYYNEWQYFYLEYGSKLLSIRVLKVMGRKLHIYEKLTKTTKIRIEKEIHQPS